MCAEKPRNTPDYVEGRIMAVSNTVFLSNSLSDIDSVATNVVQELGYEAMKPEQLYKS